MTTDINTRNLSGHELDVADLEQTARRCLLAQAADMPALSLAFVDDERIAHLNKRLLGHEGVTDVISFEAEEGEGEIIISVDRAVEQARTVGHTLEEELRFLIAHGVLHALGWDDSTPQARERMIKRQHELLG